MTRDTVGSSELIAAQETVLAARHSALASCEWIKAFVKIQSVEEFSVASGGSIPFDMWPLQERALGEIEDSEISLCVKARQIGMTWVALAWLVKRALCEPGFTAAVVSQTKEDSYLLMDRIQFMVRHLPGWMCHELPEGGRGLGWRGNATTLVVYHPPGADGSRVTSIIKVGPSTPRGVRGRALHVLLMDEYSYHTYQKESFGANLPSVLRPDHSGKIVLISTLKRGSFFGTLWMGLRSGSDTPEFAEIRERGSIAHIFLGWDADPRRTDEWYAQQSAILGDDVYVEYPASEEEAFHAGSDTMYSEFRAEYTVVDDFEPPAHWRSFVGSDAGYVDPYHLLRVAIGDDGFIYCIEESTRTRRDAQVSYEEQGAIIGGWMTEGKRVDFVVAGHDSFSTSQARADERTICDFMRIGIKRISGKSRGFIKGSFNRKFQAQVIHEYLRPIPDPFDIDKLVTRVRICRRCTTLIEMIPLLTRDPKDRECWKDMPGSVDLHGDHSPENLARCLLLVSAGVPSSPEVDDEFDEVKDRRANPVKYHKDRVIRDQAKKSRKRSKRRKR